MHKQSKNDNILANILLHNIGWNEKRKTSKLLKIEDKSKKQIALCNILQVFYHAILQDFILLRYNKWQEVIELCKLNNKRQDKNIACALMQIKKMTTNVSLPSEEDGSFFLCGLSICCLHCMKDEVQGGRYVFGAQVRNGIRNKYFENTVRNACLSANMFIDIKRYQNYG